MTVENFLDRVTSVRRCGRGWLGCCPAHDDKTPSLSIHEGDRGILLRCWAGCTLLGICAALDIHLRDLFFDDRPDQKRQAEARTRRQMDMEKFRLGLSRAGILQEAEAVIKAATGLEISSWTEAQLGLAIAAASRAHEILWEEALHHGG